MSVYEFKGAVPLGAVAAFRVVSLVERVLESLAAWRSARITEAKLRALSDQQLADIGVHRGTIAAVATRLARA